MRFSERNLWLPFFLAATPLLAGAAPGLDTRPGNSSCIAPARELVQGPSTVQVVQAFPAAPAFTQPTKILQAPGNAGHWYVVEKTGRIKVFHQSQPATVQTWLDFSARVNASSEGGLLGLAFHPLYPGRPEVFVAYTTGSPMRLVIARLILDDVETPVSVTEQQLLAVEKPYDNHNGGDLAFGNDGYLYVSVGDGGGAGDTNDFAQNTRRLLGKMLRIDAFDSSGWPAAPYQVPPDNPFAASPRCGPAANGAACPEIFAWGFRNVWRFSIDPATGALWAADVGQGAREEIDIVELGGNYGWRCREGTAPYNTAGCPSSGFAGPVFEYTHGNGDASITGGYVYRGANLPFLQGRYVFADYVSGRIWALRDNDAGGYLADQLADTSFGISAFALGHDQELYFTDLVGGRIYSLVPGSSTYQDPVPDDLAATGCTSSTDPRQPAPGMIPYRVNAPFWSDGASKIRHLAIPDGTVIARGQDGDWSFPAGSVLMKTFELAGNPVETRLLMRHPDGGWAGYTYEWNSTTTAATRVRGGKTRFVSGQDWIHPSEGQCDQCHTSAAGFTLGLETQQLNGTQLYPTTGRSANQLETLTHIGMLVPGVSDPETEARFPGPANAAAPLDMRARTWLHTNCSHCHRPGAPTGMAMDLRFQEPLSVADTRTCDVVPQAGNLGIENARIIAPGDPARSVLLQRIVRRDVHGMPPLASSQPDTAGAQLIADWIGALETCSPNTGCHVTE